MAKQIEPWRDFETAVRGFAEHIWGADGSPENIAGVDIDFVVRKNPELYYLVEITRERSLDKVREDVNKLITAKNYLFNQEHVFAKCYCVVDCESVTTSMVQAGQHARIECLTFHDFKQKFFSYDQYERARGRLQFGSAVDPVTGAKDESPYVKSTFTQIGHEYPLTTQEVANLLIEGRRIILTGEYGSGKSRCVQEIFREICTVQAHTNRYPVAVDLRHNWGLKRYQEILRRHCEDLGLSSLADDMLKALVSGALIFLLDGFDEVGSQAWSIDSDKLRAIRAQSLEGVKDLVREHRGGLLVTGREHYFNNNEEMLHSLGLDGEGTIILRSQEEFSQAQLNEYLTRIATAIEIPSWLPRRPLICKTIADLPAEDLERMFLQEGGDIDFWFHFIEVLCKRDATTHVSFDAASIFKVLKHLARNTRVKPADVGPISLAEIQSAFQEVVGQAPIEQASIMLQRLPGLGRVRAESDDRQFIDGYILDGLRAVDLSAGIDGFDTSIDRLSWRNPLDKLGQRICSSQIEENNALKKSMTLAGRYASANNRVAASDIIASLVGYGGAGIDFAGLDLREGHFIILDLSQSHVKNLTLTDCTLSHLVFPAVQPTNLHLNGCLVEHVYGISSAKGLPDWVRDCSFDTFESVQNVSRIKRIGLSASQEVLAVILRKTFFQKGSGRKEEALKRGLGELGRLGLPDRVVNYLVSKAILKKVKGNEGWVYIPNRQYSNRMDKILSDLTLSSDPIWLDVSALT